MPLQIRPATPADIPMLAQVQLMAARSQLPRGLFDIMLDSPEPTVLDFLEQLLQTSTRSWGHYTTYLVADLDGQPAAALCCYDPLERGGPVLEQAMAEALTAQGLADHESQSAFWQRFAPLTTCLPPDADGAWVVETVAALPQFRRRGLVDALLRAALDQGRQRGHAFAQIMALIGNTPAIQAYEKVGFRVVEEHRHPDFEAAMGAPGTLRMICPLV